MSAQRADDRPARARPSLVGSLGLEEGPQAALTEAVLTLELPGTPATRVIDPVTHTALEL